MDSDMPVWLVIVLAMGLAVIGGRIHDKRRARRNNKEGWWNGRG